jgi:eukaryotic-like serine/threonine-protein kinase
VSLDTARLQAALADRYRIERELGRGGMATVYLAQDLRHDRPVALKLLHPELAAALGPERFLHEIRTAAKLQHPHILPLFDSGAGAAGAGQLWYTMPYVEGETLRIRLQRERQLPLDDALRITTQVLSALDYAHAHGVIHRDIKPENILLEGDQAVVADLGIARAIGAAGDDRLTETGLAVGTVAYMSPEQAVGQRDLDGRTDIYSLGVVLYEMLAGEAPFTGPTAQAIIARRLTEAPRPLRSARETVPAAVDQAVMKALARAPADRHPTAAAFSAALKVGAETADRAREAVRPRRSKRLVGILAGITAAALLGIFLRSRAATPSGLNPSLLAVAPFDVLDPKFQLWQEGMVDLLSRNLDGAGPLRTVSPTVVVRRWSGRADPESAGELGRRTGAGLSLYGSLLSSGRDSVRIRATLLDVAHGSTMEEWEFRDAADRIDRLTDSLTMRVLQGLGRTRPIGSVRLTSFGSTSLPAVKAFLQGEQHLRRAEWDSALAYYERAIRLDSTFPLALRRASTALGWTRTGYDSLSNAYALRAGAANHGLPPRDSLLVLSDSLFAAMFAAGPLGLRADSSWGSRLQRFFATVEDATTRYPEDPEAWNNLGEADDHFGTFVGRSYQQQLDAFDRAIELDSAYAPAYLHPISISAMDGPDAVRRYLRPYLALGPHDVNTDGNRLVARLLDAPSDLTTLPAVVRGLSADALFSAYTAFDLSPDSAETAVAIARILASRSWSGLPFSRPGWTQRLLALALLGRGHLRAGYKAMPDNTNNSPLPIFAEAALMGAVPAEQAAATFKKALSDTAPPPAVAYPWWASRRDTASLQLSVTRAEALGRSDPARRPRAAYLAASAKAYLTLTSGDTTGAIQQLLALPQGVCPSCYLDQLTVARLLVDRRRDREAWPILRGEHISSTLSPFPSAILWSLLRARVAERIGERDLAIHSYSWVAAMWGKADPELQPYVTEAREGLARLTSERK